MAEVLVGKANGDKLSVTVDKTQVYGLAGNDTLESKGKNDILIIGGSGNDVLNMTGGNGTLNGGAGADTFNLFYSANQKLSAVIEDLDPTNDKIIINYDGSDAPTLNYSIQNSDVILTDENGNINVTLKGIREVNDYYDQIGNNNIWEILRLVNQEREKSGLNQLTLSQGLTDGATIRSQEIINNYSHTRPNGTSCFTAITKSYSSMGENIYSSPSSPEAAMEGWMNSPGHRANILNSGYKKLGVGYTYDASSQWKYHWVQMFGGSLNSTETVSADEILNTETALKVADSAVSSGALKNITDEALSGESIKNNDSNTVITGTAASDTIDNYGDSVSADGSKGNDILINGQYFEHGGANVSLYGGAGADTLTSHGSKSLLDGGANSDVIYNGYRYYESWNYFYDSDSDDYNGNNSTITGGTGNDTIKNLGSNVTITAGADDDFIENKGSNVLFKYASGDGFDYISGFDATSTLQIDGSYSTQKSGADIIVTVDKSKIILAGTADLSKINISKTSKTPATLLTATNKTKSPVTVSSSIKVINASKRTKAIKITGNALANTISGGSKNDSLYGGKGNDSIVGNAGNDKLYGNAGKDTLKGGKGNDSLWGGAGDDKLYGGAGKDIFIYKPGEGKDKIYDYAAGDMLKILKTNGKEGGSFTKAKFSSGDLTLTIKGGGTVVFDDVSKGDKFNINGKSYTIKGSTLK